MHPPFNFIFPAKYEPITIVGQKPTTRARIRAVVSCAYERVERLENTITARTSPAPRPPGRKLRSEITVTSGKSVIKTTGST